MASFGMDAGCLRYLAPLHDAGCFAVFGAVGSFGAACPWALDWLCFVRPGGAMGSFPGSWEQRNRSATDAFLGEEEHARGPGLVFDAHRLARSAVVPFVEFAL